MCKPLIPYKSDILSESSIYLNNFACPYCSKGLYFPEQGESGRDESEREEEMFCRICDRQFRIKREILRVYTVTPMI